MNTDFVAVFEHARDADNHIGRLVRSEIENMPPSRALRKRLVVRGRDDFQDPPKVKTPEQLSTRVLADRRRAFHAQLIADLGGSATVKPSFDGTYYNAEQRGLLTYIEPAQKRPAVAFKREDETYPERKRLYVQTKSELARMTTTEHQMSLLDVIEFGE